MNTKRIKQALFLLLILTSGVKSIAQCPSIDCLGRTTYPPYVQRGWDAAVTCATQEILIIDSTFITPQTITNDYTVESIPFNPPDTSFWSTAGGGAQIILTSDDGWQSSGIQTLPFDFVFYGNTYSKAIVSPNGTVKFGTTTELNSLVGNTMPYNASNYSLPSNETHLTNSILGLYEDIDMGNSNQAANTGIPHAGIYRAVYDTFPCRKLVVNYNAIPKFGHTSTTEAPTHWSRVQIVCYEGTNIIEVHIQRHSAACGTDGNSCIVGINKDGTHAHPAPGRNRLTNQDITTPEAWRWRPVGTTYRNIEWYYGTDTSAATGIKLHNCDSITVYNDGMGGDTAIRVRPTVPTTYTTRMRYIGANGIRYDLANYYRVGINKDHDMRLSGIGSNGIQTDTIDVCQGTPLRLELQNPESGLTTPFHTSWTCDYPSMNSFVQGQGNTNNINISANQSSAMFLTHPDWRDKLVKFDVVTDFDNGCSDSAQIFVRFYNRFNDTTRVNICDGQSYVFHGVTYNQTGTHSIDTTNAAGCVYTNTLRLTVYHPNDTVISIKNCQPYTWIDGNTYDHSTNEPTILLTNRYGCDSTIRLNFVLDDGLDAIINVVPEAATLDHLHIQLKDVSLASDARIWVFPDGRRDTNITVYYDFPTDKDSVTIMLVAIRNYPEFNSHCYDTAYVTIPLLKEAIWFPNAFTPKRDNNDVFKIVGIGITSLEVSIYDRAGRLVNSWTGVDGFWDGNSKDGHECVPGSYVYIARYTTVLNPRDPKTHKGQVLLIR